MRLLVHHVPSFADRSYLTLALSRKAAARHERMLAGVGWTPWFGTGLIQTP
jgi:hypothetical protein